MAFRSVVNKRGWLFACSFLGACCFAVSCSKQDANLENLQSKNSYFQRIPVLKFPGPEVCVITQIEQEHFLAKLDLGFEGEVSVFRDIVERIQEKRFVESCEMYGVRGIRHSHPVYEIPEIWVNGISVKRCHLLVEEKQDRLSQVSRQGEQEIVPYKGYLGWKLFESLCVFLDLYNYEFICFDSLSTFEKRARSTFLQESTVIPFTVEHGFIEFIAILDGNSCHCILDTGSTLNILNQKENRSLEEIAFLPETKLSTSLRIGNQMFGQISVRLLPVAFPCDMILGMEFLKNHQVLIDFPNKKLYIARENVGE